MAITPLPTPPSPTDSPQDFNTKAFDLLNALPDFVTETNATAVQVDADKTTATGAASTATTKANEASASADLAEDWATKTDGAVAGGEFSAKKYAQDSSDSADASAASAVEAAGLVENYQGALASDPSLNKDGDPLQAGDWYVNTSTGLIRAYDGTQWVTSVNVTAGVSSFSAGSTGLTPSTGTQGDVTLAGTLGVSNGGTGATSLTGVLVGNGTNALSGVTTGTEGQILKLAGSPLAPSWGDLPSGADLQEFSASGTWTKPAGATFVMVEVWGAGGGGGGGASRSGGDICGGTGGGGGSYAQLLFKASDLTDTVSVTIGAGGTGGAALAAAAGLSGNNGTDGGNTTFGAYLTAYGGEKGLGGDGSGIETVTRGGYGAGVTYSGISVDRTLNTNNSFSGGLADLSNNANITKPGGSGGAGGGAGGGSPTRSTGGNGGGAAYGGGGGGAGGGHNNSVPFSYSGGSGGSNTAANGSGGTGGAVGTNGGSGLNRQGGGGGGCSNRTGGPVGAGGTGGFPAGGGGGGGAGIVSSPSGAGGTGGAGLCRVYSW